MKASSRVPAQVCRVDVENAGSGDGGRGGRPQVADLEHQPHGAVQGDSLVAGQGEDLGRKTGLWVFRGKCAIIQPISHTGASQSKEEEGDGGPVPVPTPASSP